MDDLDVEISCTNCQEVINGVRVQCSVCPEFYLCLLCFSDGAEIGPHKSDHAYKLIDSSNIKPFGDKTTWTGKEELLLLEALELYGYGNWELVSKYVKTKTSEEVREEYMARYLNGNIGQAVWAKLHNHKPILHEDVPVEASPILSKLPPMNLTEAEANLLGYKPNRDDYEWEYDMEAEELMANMQVDVAQESEMEVALKLAVVDIYTRRLRERARRKRIVREYQLVSKYFANLRKNPPKTPLSKEQMSLRDKFRVFSQYLTSDEHSRIVASIEREQELRFRLSELLRYRSLGLTTQAEIIHYERHAAFQRKQQLKMNKTSENKGQKWLGNVSGSLITKKRKPKSKRKFFHRRKRNVHLEKDSNHPLQEHFGLEENTGVTL